MATPKISDELRREQSLAHLIHSLTTPDRERPMETWVEEKARNFDERCQAAQIIGELLVERTIAVQTINTLNAEVSRLKEENADLIHSKSLIPPMVRRWLHSFRGM